MARVTRIALDLALVSLRTVGPVVYNLWSATKNLIISTKAKPLVCNPIIRKAESTVDKIASLLMSKIKNLRDRQLPKEAKYLENELEKVKKKMNQKENTASKSLRPGCATAWRYAKVEMIPPMTKGFFHGSGGKKLEDSVSSMVDNFIAGLEGRIREIEAEKERQIKAKQAAIKAAHDKAIAEAKKRENEKLKAEAEKKAQEAKLAKEKAAKAEKKEKVEKKADAKADAKTDKPKDPKKSKKVKRKEIKKPRGKGKGKK